jgi:hypothetical protein
MGAVPRIAPTLSGCCPENCAHSLACFPQDCKLAVECGNGGSAIFRVRSQHNNRKEDRQFEVYCAGVGFGSSSRAFSHGSWNDWDRPFYKKTCECSASTSQFY